MDIEWVDGFETTREVAYRTHKAVGFKELKVEDGYYLLEITREDYLE